MGRLWRCCRGSRIRRRRRRSEGARASVDLKKEVGGGRAEGEGGGMVEPEYLVKNLTP